MSTVPDFPPGTPAGAQLCSLCGRRQTCRYRGKGRNRRPVCGPCKKGDPR